MAAPEVELKEVALAPETNNSTSPLPANLFLASQHQSRDEEDEEDALEKDEGEEASLLPDGFSMVPLNHDIYSLMFTGNLRARGFWFGLFVALFQGTIVWLVLYDLIDWSSDSTNPLQIPAGNEIAVTIARAFLMILMSQDSTDLMEGLEFLIDGYHPEVLNLCPHASVWKWALAGVAHLMVGALLVVVIFVLLMQETTVFGLGVDFVAMNKFFALIDNKAFAIARRGVFSIPLQDEIKQVDKVKIRTNTKYTNMRGVRDMTLMALVMMGYGIITYQQQHGYFVCDSLFVQFGDVFNPGIVEISGMFDRLGLDDYHDRRAVYQERSTGEFVLAYCASLKRWTMTPYFDVLEPCGSDAVRVLARSGIDEGFDILATADTWMVDAVRHGSGFNPFTHFSMKCNECDNECNANGGTCNESNDCVCYAGYFGVNCELEAPCPEMTISLATEPFPPFLSDYPVPKNFTMLTFADGYRTEDEEGTFQNEYRPVFYGEGPNANWVLTFLGRRWIIYGLPPTTRSSKESVVAAFSSSNYSAIDSIFAPIFVSSPMDVGSPSDGATPADLEWFYATRKFQGDVIDSVTRTTLDDDTPPAYATTWWVEENQPLSTRLVCAFCDKDTNPCKNFGTCDEVTRTCSCVKEVGALCEYEQKCTDRDNENDPNSIIGCPFNATCGVSGRCDCPGGYQGNTCQQEVRGDE